MKISETLETAAKILRNAEIAEPVREAKSLLAEAIKRNQTFLIAHSEYELSADEEKSFRNFIERRANREPFQYIVGRQEFFGLDFFVNEAVLIPRPETEMLVEAAIETLPANGRFCEIGVGSGCISISILHTVQTAGAIGLDVSERALNVAGKNAETHRVAERFELKISDVYENLLAEKFDLIVSNPPYIPREDIEILQPEVRDFEPRNALTDESDGLSIVKRIINGAPEFLKPRGFLLLEIGIHQSNEVREMFDTKIWCEIDVLPDLQNIPRTVRAQIK